MSRIKILIAVLAVIASAGLVNCSEFKANNSTIASGADLSTFEPTREETEQQRLAREMKEKMQYRATILTDLKRISLINRTEGTCSSEDRDKLINLSTEHANRGQVIQSIPPVSRIKDSKISAAGINLASIALAKDLTAADNQYCALNVASSVADHAVKNFMEIPVIDMLSSEEYSELVEKSASIRDNIKPVVDQIIEDLNVEIRAPFVRQATIHGNLSKEINNRIENLEKDVVIIRSSYTCDEVTPCDSDELHLGSEVVTTLALVKTASETLSRIKIEGPGDANLDSKNKVLEQTLSDLNTRSAIMTALSNKIKLQILREECLGKPSAGCDADDISEKLEAGDDELEAFGGSGVEIQKNPAVEEQYEEEQLAIDAYRKKKLQECGPNCSPVEIYEINKSLPSNMK